MKFKYAKVVSLTKTIPRFKLDSHGYMKQMVNNVCEIHSCDTSLNKYRLYALDKRDHYVFDGDDLILMTEEKVDYPKKSVDPLLFDIKELNL